MKFSEIFVVILLSFLVLVSHTEDISSSFTYHGYIPGIKKFSKIKIGQNKETVAKIISFPSIKSIAEKEIFQNIEKEDNIKNEKETWYYIGIRFAHYSFTPKMLSDVKTFFVSFDNQGKVYKFGIIDENTTDKKKRVVPFLREDLERSRNSVLFPRKSIERRLEVKEFEINKKEIIRKFLTLGNSKR